jgi:hypothetical protein
MDAHGRGAAFGVTGIENGAGFDRPETETNRYRDNRATESSEGSGQEKVLVNLVLNHGLIKLVH